MPRLFLGNFEFEHRLAAPGRQLPAKLQRLNAELATSWLAIADDGDFLWTPEPIDPKFFDEATTNGLPRVLPIASLQDVPAGVECIPWGWTDDIRKLCDSHGWIRNDPPDHAVRAANSRRLSSELEQEWRVGLPFSGEATSLDQIERYIALHDNDSRWVIKAEFGMSGRERLLGTGVPQGADRSWIEKRLQANGIVFFEPWVSKISEVGIQIDIPREGDPRLLEVVPMIADERGQYSGSHLPAVVKEQTHIVLRPSEWGLAIDIALQAARRIQDLGYFGPLGIDAMQFQDENGQRHVRPLQDINARYTMGRLSLGFRKLLNKYVAAEWLHGSSNLVVKSRVRRTIFLLRMMASNQQLTLPAGFENVVERLHHAEGVVDDNLLIDLLHADSEESTVRLVVALLEEIGLLRIVSEVAGHKLYSIPDVHRWISTSPEIVGEQQSLHCSKLWIQ